MPTIPEVIDKVKGAFQTRKEGETSGETQVEAFDHDKVYVVFVLGGPGAGSLFCPTI